MIRKIVVLGGGSAGLIAALTLRRTLPEVDVRVVRSPEIGVIGVGEGTTPYFPAHLFQYLRLDQARFYSEAQPTWKIGIRFVNWGPRSQFHYTFTKQFDCRWHDLPKAHGFYCEEDCESVDLASALVAHGRAFPRNPAGWPQLHPYYAFHIENQKLVAYLESCCREAGVCITDAHVEAVERGDDTVERLRLASGESVEGDLFLDASGFRSELLGRTFQEPFYPYDRTLFCDRAVIGGWPRSETEPIMPCTVAEAMDAGWCWQIEHEHWINRGYVYSSRFISDDAARDEFVRKNPRVMGERREPRVVKFRTGRFRRMWVGNVVGIGNASGFVEPLEATALAVMMLQSRSLADSLAETSLEPTPSARLLYNRIIGEVWDDIRDFLAIHYAFNTRSQTPFWQACRGDTDFGEIYPLLEFYRENGPTGLARHTLPHTHNIFGLEGYLALLIGQRVPYEKRHRPCEDERRRWSAHRNELIQHGQAGMTIRQCLDAIRHPAWQWT